MKQSQYKIGDRVKILETTNTALPDFMLGAIVEVTGFTQAPCDLTNYFNQDAIRFEYQDVSLYALLTSIRHITKLDKALS